MGARHKATGWKVPLLFCGAMLIVVALGALLRRPPAPPDLAPALLTQARGLAIDLSAPEGRPWKEAIVSAASGFAAPGVKAERLAAVAAEATAAGRLDAALAAAVQMQDDARRDASMESIFRAAVASCANLPWAVFAVHGMRGQDLAAASAAELDACWRACNAAHAALAP